MLLKRTGYARVEDKQKGGVLGGCWVQQYLMINYSKVRESVQKQGSKKSLGRINKSHTSSINIKLIQDTPVEHIKLPIRGVGKDKSEMQSNGKASHQHSQQKKYSVKLQSNEKENKARRVEPYPYDVTIFRPFQESNRYLQTQRLPKQYKMHQERSSNKPALRLRTQHHEGGHIRTDYTDATPEKYRKEVSTKHTTENSTKIVRVNVQDVKRLMSQLIKEKAEVVQLKKQLRFYQRHAGEGNSNPVLRSLRF